MSDTLNNPRVLKRLCDNISHTISTLHNTGMIPVDVQHLFIDVKDTKEHHFTVTWGDHLEDMQQEGLDSHVFEDFTIGIIGGGSQSLQIAAVVAETVISSLNMVQEDAVDRAW